MIVADTKYVWAGWLVLLELDGTDSDAVLRKYTWGLDVAGQNGQINSLESAGGIGGLLAVYDTNGTTTGQNPTEDDKTYVYLYDANGNVGQLVAWVDGYEGATGSQWHGDRMVATYEYTPYGTLRASAGDYADDNPFRFSTKYWDDETGLGYWGYRYYSPTLGRWISRDPMDEAGGLNLQSFVRNDAASRYDVLGLLSIATPITCEEYWRRWKAANPGFTERQYEAMLKTLKHGCIGIVALHFGVNLEGGERLDLSRCYRELGRAADRVEEIWRECECQGRDQNGDPSTPWVFGVSFWTNRTMRPRADGTWPLPSDWDEPRDDDFVNFDFAWFDAETGRWVHANHCHPDLADEYDENDPMKVYTDDWPHYSDFNTRLWCVACKRHDFGRPPRRPTSRPTSQPTSGGR